MAGLRIIPDEYRRGSRSNRRAAEFSDEFSLARSSAVFPRDSGKRNNPRFRRRNG